MNKFSHIRPITALFIGVLVSSLHAQTADENHVNTSNRSPGQSSLANATDSTQTLIGTGDEQMQYTPALDGSGLISMDSAMPKRILVGAVVSGGWDSNPDNLANGASSGLYTLSPYVGIQSNSSSTRFLLQYQPTITGYSSGAYSNQTMHAASIAILGNVNERWKWDLNASGNHGEDATRFIAPQQSIAVGEVPGAGPNSASYLANAGTVTFVTGSAGVHYRKSERDSFEFGIANTFSRYAGFSDNNSIASTNFGYDRALSSSFDMRAYEQTYYYYGAINCPSFGGGVGIKWHVLDGTFLSLSGGPQLNTAACGKQQKFSYSAAFSTRLTGKSQIYVLTAREPAISYLGPGLWQTSASGGYQRQVLAAGTLKFDVGYVSSDTLTVVNSYHGTYINFVYGVQLGHGLNASYNYRGYVGDTGGTGFSRNVASFSLAWTPNAGHLFQ
jgi:hypothetical protein